MSQSLRNNTDRRKSAAFAGIDDRFRTIFDSVEDGIFISDPANGQFIEVNRRGCGMFGYEPGELIGLDIANLSSGIHPYTLEQGIENAHIVSAGKSMLFEWQCATKARTFFWAEISIRYAEIGGIPVIVAIVRNIDERKRLNEELVRAMNEAAEANKAKNAFLAIMSHELRTPLNAIIGFSDMMVSQCLGPLGNLRYREYSADIHDSGLQLLRLIDDLLDLSRIDAGKTELYENEFSLGDVADEACRMVELGAQKSGLEIRNEIPPDLCHIFADERRVKQIVLNLLSNAIKFTPPGGRVIVRAAQSAEGLVLEVADTGIGIAEADLPKVLERFGRVDNEYSRKTTGTGLGLPLVKTLIELHGGSISLASTLGAGTTVSIVFPPGRVIKAANSSAA